MKTIALSSLLLLAVPVVNAFPAAVSGLLTTLQTKPPDHYPKIFNNPAVHDSLIHAMNRGIQSRSTNSTLANLVNGILNGSLPGVPFPSFNLPLGLGSLLLEVPPVVAIGRKAIPDADHPFQAPGPTDQRGGCPGLNSKPLSISLGHVILIKTFISSHGKLRLYSPQWLVRFGGRIVFLNMHPNSKA